ncbi:MAG: transcriptional regulator [Croceibacterium sp.]
MSGERFRFEGFILDCPDRRVTRDGDTIELNARYFDALALLVSQPGKLVSKDRFHDEVWRGIPVTDEALTQCIRTLRRQLGDDAARPRIIETVPKHGYRFIAPVDRAGPRLAASANNEPWTRYFRLAAAGTGGGTIAGAIGGLLYGFIGATQPLAQGMGAASVVLVIALVTVSMATLGAAGVAAGIAASVFATKRRALTTVIGGALGGLVVGAMVKLVGTDALNLLFGHAPGSITGAPEGAVIGTAIAIGSLRTWRSRSLETSMAWGGLAGALAGLAVPLLGGRLMSGSLTLLAGAFPGSRIDLGAIGQMFGEVGFGPLSSAATSSVEGLLFGACMVGAMWLVQRPAAAADSSNLDLAA